MFLPSNMTFSYMRELLFSQLREKTNILVATRIAFLRRELLLGKSTKNSLNLLQTRITQRKVILVCIVRESLILVCFLGENYIKPRRELSFSLLENDNSRLNIVILPLIRGENHVIRGTITVSSVQKSSHPLCWPGSHCCAALVSYDYDYYLLVLPIVWDVLRSIFNVKC